MPFSCICLVFLKSAQVEVPPEFRDRRGVYLRYAARGASLSFRFAQFRDVLVDRLLVPEQSVVQDKYTSLVVGQDAGFRAYGIFQEFDELDVMQQRVEVNGVRVGFALCGRRGCRRTASLWQACSPAPHSRCPASPHLRFGARPRHPQCRSRRQRRDFQYRKG